MEMERGLAGSYAAAVSIMTEARELVTNIVECDKPIVSMRARLAAICSGVAQLSSAPSATSPARREAGTSCVPA
jgi:hypothetical protein